MEPKELTVNHVKIYLYLKRWQTWTTNKDLATALGMTTRNANLHTRCLVELGILEQALTSPGYRYRYSADAETRNPAYLQRLEQAADIFQDELSPYAVDTAHG